MPGTATLVFLVLFTSLMSTTTLAQLEIPCIEFHPRLDFPCLCGLNDINATRINCDGVAFREFPFLPFKFYIQEFQQQHAGLQTLGEFFLGGKSYTKIEEKSEKIFCKIIQSFFKNLPVV